MRNIFALLFLSIIIALGSCSVIAHRSRKPIGRAVEMLTGCLIPPVIGNMIIVLSQNLLVSQIGCYIYFIGMDFVMFALLYFTFRYCSISWKSIALRNAVYSLLAADILQLLLNPIFGQAFSNERIIVYGAPYYRLVPHLGQTFHRIVDYGILAAVIIIFIVKVIRTPKIYSERFTVILFTMLLASAWQTLYIFSRSPIDRSMIGFGVFGLMTFYFSLYYRPMRLLDRMLANIASELPEALFFFDAGNRCIWANDEGRELTELQAEDYEQSVLRLAEMFGREELPEQRAVQRTVGSGSSIRYFILEKHTVRNDKTRVIGSFLTVRDTTEEQLRVKQEMYNATHDRLTGLYTREYLYQRIRRMLEQHPDVSYQIVFVDVKNFKIVNDIFSNAFGDFALKCIASWIRSDMSELCVYGRLAGDTFGVLVPTEEFDADQLEEELSRYYVREGNVEYHILIHLGVYRIEDTSLDVSVMFDRAHLALSTIRDEYHAHIAYYNAKLRDKLLWDQQISSQLREAIDTRQLRPYLQPIVNAEGKLVGAEALARWIHPKEGFLAPYRFIPVFEQNGMIVEIDRHMWRCACELLSRWTGPQETLFISVYISPKDFYFTDVAAEIRELVREYGIPPRRLRIEITETVMMNDADDRMKILNDLREDGFIVEMDDFGSGYSSLNMLKDMPVDVLKVDMKFLSKSRNEQRSRKIVQNILQLSDDLEIASLTEGVETEEQFRMLADMHCKLFQGYYFAKPLSEEEFENTYFGTAS